MNAANHPDRSARNSLQDENGETGALETKVAKTRALKQGMMQELLTGRIRLV